MIPVSPLLGRCSFPPPGTAIDCAVSGGADSLALMALGVMAGCSVQAWHVDHGLRPGSEDAAVVDKAAARWDVPVRHISLSVAPGPNLEDRARRARYAALPAGVLTGHTADDQAETVLLALLRGAGLDGLCGMAASSDVAAHPLLALRHAETVDLCASLGLSVVQDPTNEDPRFVRNRLRHELIPLASSIAGRDVVPRLARAAALLQADRAALAAMTTGVDPTDARALAAAPIAVARRAVRAWLAANAGPGAPPYPPSFDAVERVLDVARGSVLACEVAGVGRVSRHRQQLIISGTLG